VAKNNNKKNKTARTAKKTASDARSKKAFKITSKITKSNAQTLQEVRSGIYV